MSKSCIINGCNRKQFGHGWCNTHYRRWYIHGDVNRRKLTTEERFWKYVQKTEDCWLWIKGLDDKGYGVFTIMSKKISAHRYSYFLHTGRRPTLSVLHSCDNPPCVNPAHLREGTQADNMQDAIARSGHLIGQKNPRAKLTPEQVKEIRDQPKTYGSGRTLAKRYGVTPSVIWSIRHDRTWQSI